MISPVFPTVYCKLRMRQAGGAGTERLLNPGFVYFFFVEMRDNGKDKSAVDMY